MDFTSLLFGGNGQTVGDYTQNAQYQSNPQLQAGYTAGSAGAMAQGINPTQQAQFRNMQMQQAQQLQGVASGQQQGAGELAVQRQVANAQAAQQAQAMSARGGANAALAFRGAANNTAAVGLSGAGQAQQAALTDQQTAQGQLSNVLNQGRGQDQSQIGLQQTQYANNNAANLGYLNGLSSMDQGQLNAATSAYGATQSNPGMLGGLINGAGGAIGKAIMASDARLKTDVRSGGDDIDAMLDGLVAKTYRYKDAKHGDGPRAGIMAQDLERSKAGRALVVDLPTAPGYKGVDVNKALSAALASAARLNERLRKLEQRSV